MQLHLCWKTNASNQHPSSVVLSILTVNGKNNDNIAKLQYIPSIMQIKLSTGNSSINNSFLFCWITQTTYPFTISDIGLPISTNCICKSWIWNNKDHESTHQTCGPLQAHLRAAQNLSIALNKVWFRSVNKALKLPIFPSVIGSKCLLLAECVTIMLQ